MEAAARATVSVLDRMLEPGIDLLDGARVIQAMDRDMVFAAVKAMNGRDSVLLTGTAEVKDKSGAGGGAGGTGCDESMDGGPPAGVDGLAGLEA